MIGSAGHLGRWLFSAAVVFLLAAECLMVAGYGYPATPAEALAIFLLVHTVTIGWLSLSMCGALLQFVPVLVARPLRNEAFVLPALMRLLADLTSVLTGFLQLTGTFGTDLPFMLINGCLLPVGFALILWTLGRTLGQAWPSPLPARFVAAELGCMTATISLCAL